MCVLALASRTALDTPWQRRGGRAIKVNGPVPLEARPGWFVQLPIIGGLNQPPRLRPAKEASQHFLNGRSHPSLSKEGTSTFPSVVFNAPVFSKRCGTWQAGTGEEYAFRVIRAIRGCLFIISKAEFPLTAAARDADTFVGFYQNIRR